VGGQNHHIAGDMGSERPLRPRKPMMSADPAIKLRTNGRARPAISAMADVADYLRSIDGFGKMSFTEIAQ
jgi:hypothetical protein